MRIDRLDLTRYGRFTDHSLDFGGRTNGPDFHIVYGPNEAGKSTLRDAFLHFLYGIPVKTPYNFIHDYELLEIGATLTLKDGPHCFRRIKKRQQDLLGPDGNPVAPGILKAALEGISLENYKTMFSLDDETLKEGGEGMLASEGDLGQMLFSAASGLSGLGRQIEKIKTEAAAFFKPTGRSFELADEKKKLKDLEQRIKDADINAGTYEKLVQTQTSMREQYESAKIRQDLDRREITRLETILALIPLWHRRKAIVAELEGLSSEPDLPDGWLKEAQKLARNHAGRAADFKHARAALDKARQKHADISIDKKILELAPDIERLTKDEFEARFRTSRDISLRQKEVEGLGEKISRLLQKLDRSDIATPAELVLPAATISSLSALINERSVIDTLTQKAAQELTRANDEHQQAQDALSKFGTFNDLTTFNELFQALSSDYPTADLQAGKVTIARLEQDVRFALHQLAPWQGTPENLVELVPPSKTLIEDLKSSASKIADYQRSTENRLHEGNIKISELQAELNSRSTITGIFDDNSATKARAAREQAWINHRLTLNAPLDESNQSAILSSAQSFKKTMNEDDTITTARFHHTSELAALRQLQIELGKCQSKQQTNRQTLDELHQSEDRLRVKISQVMDTLDLPTDTPLAELDPWLDKRREAIGTFKSLELERQKQSILTSTGQKKRHALVRAMKKAGLPTTAEDWITTTTIAAQAIENWKNTSRDQKSAKKALNTAKKDFKSRETDATKATKAKRRWKQQWRECLHECWLGESSKQRPDKQPPSPIQVRDMLITLVDLEQQLEKTDELKTRIGEMQADRDSYIREVERIHLIAGKNAADQAPLAIADALRSRLTNAVRNSEELDQRAREIEAEEKKHAIAQQALEKLDARFEKMTTHFPADDFSALLERMERSHKKFELKEKAEDLESEIITRLKYGEFAKAEAVLRQPAEDESSHDVLSARFDSLQSAKKDTDEHVRDLFHEWQSAEKDLSAIGGDAQVAKMQEEKRTLLLDLQAKTMHFLELSAGAMLLDHALQKYRETHQSSLMEQASKAFATITSGEFSGFQSVNTGSREILVGIRSDGSTIKVEEMSKGTRFQLYLSLRIAGHAEYAEHRTPLPFFADDILETFDDKRSTQTLSLLHEMSRRGQVIYLTHHQHICDLARKTCGSSATIHNLHRQS